LISQKNSGPSVARNNALKIAKGIYIVMLDADDLIRKDTINCCVEKLDVNKNIAVVYGNCMWFGEKQGLKKQRNFDIIKQLRANEIAVCSVIRKEALESAGGFDEFLSLKGVEDWDLWLSLYEKGWEFCYMDDIMFDIRVSFTSRTFEVANNKIEELTSYVYKKHSDLLASQFIRLYHENKNFKNLTDYMVGKRVLAPFRVLKKIFMG
jgi:cellulose synthase/poly-beta-1,6-N-acetylglucosamine synthase-like glycosyltransferase